MKDRKKQIFVPKIKTYSSFNAYLIMKIYRESLSYGNVDVEY